MDRGQRKGRASFSIRSSVRGHAPDAETSGVGFQASSQGGNNAQILILCVHQKLCLGLHIVDAIEDVRGEN